MIKIKKQNINTLLFDNVYTKVDIISYSKHVKGLVNNKINVNILKNQQASNILQYKNLRAHDFTIKKYPQISEIKPTNKNLFKTIFNVIQTRKGQNNYGIIFEKKKIFYCYVFGIIVTFEKNFFLLPLYFMWYKNKKIYTKPQKYKNLLTSMLWWLKKHIIMQIPTKTTLLINKKTKKKKVTLMTFFLTYDTL